MSAGQNLQSFGFSNFLEMLYRWGVCVCVPALVCTIHMHCIWEFSNNLLHITIIPIHIFYYHRYVGGQHWPAFVLHCMGERSSPKMHGCVCDIRHFPGCKKRASSKVKCPRAIPRTCLHNKCSVRILIWVKWNRWEDGQLLVHTPKNNVTSMRL